MSYISLSEKDKKELLKKIGVSSISDLFCCIPDEIRMKEELSLPAALTEPELISYFEEVSKKNDTDEYLAFLGGGAYKHLIPTIVDYLSMRGEFLSPYTPYQPEVSQGTLQVIFEFQTLICQLTGMDIANASLYDGASGAAEAVLMAHRLRKRPKLLISRAVHPQYRQTITTYTRHLDLSTEEVGFLDSGQVDMEDLKKRLDDQTTAVVMQSPNFMGILEDIESVSRLVHDVGALSVLLIAEPVSLGIMEVPGKLGVDIVTGEAQSFGLPLSFGGPFLGFMACREEFLRQFPGRIAGQTKDIDGERGFVLTLTTREQFIRRERATSNICTNQAWCALRATIFLESLGEKGLKEMAWHNVQKTRYALDQLIGIRGVTVRFSGEVFNEFVLHFDKPWSMVEKGLRKKKILGGIPLKSYYHDLEGCVLVNVTEVHQKQDIDRFVSCVREIMED
jgi:glycine dehydrogenase subunit 1